MTKVIEYEVSDSNVFGFDKYLWETSITLGENQHFLFRNVYKLDNHTGEIGEQIGMKLVKVVDDDWLDKHDWMYYNIKIENETNKELERQYKEEFGEDETYDEFLEKEEQEMAKKS